MVPGPFWEGTHSPVTGPVQVLSGVGGGGPPSQDRGYPSARMPWPGQEVLPKPGQVVPPSLGQGSPWPGRQSECCYAVGGKPLAVTQEDFLVL